MSWQLKQNLCQMAIIKKSTVPGSLHTPPVHKHIEVGAQIKKTSPDEQCWYFLQQYNNYVKIYGTFSLSWKHKFKHTASCSSSSARAANNPFLIPSEFLLVSSSDRGNWYRVLRAFIRTCGNSRISMLINVKWKNSKFCTLRTGADQLLYWLVKHSSRLTCRFAFIFGIPTGLVHLLTCS